MTYPNALAPASLSRSFIFCSGIENSAPVIAGPDGKPCRVDGRARGASPQPWLSLHRGLVGTALAGAGLAALAWKRRPAGRLGV